MAKYIHQSIDIVIDSESDLYKSVCEVAERTGRTVESIINTVASAGLYFHMERGLSVYYGKEVKA